MTDTTPHAALPDAANGGTFTPPKNATEAIKRMADDGDADPEGTARMNYPHLFVDRGV